MSTQHHELPRTETPGSVLERNLAGEPRLVFGSEIFDFLFWGGFEKTPLLYWVLKFFIYFFGLTIVMQFIFWVSDRELQNSSSNPIKFWNAKTLIDQQLTRKNVPNTNLTDAAAVHGFPPWFSIMATIMPELDKCLKFKSVQGDKNDCTLFKITLEMPQFLDIEIIA